LNSLAIKKQLENEGKTPQLLIGSFNVFSKIYFFCVYVCELISFLSLTLKHCYTAVIYRVVSSEIIIYEERNVANLLFINKP